MAVFDALVSTGLDVRDCRVPGYRNRGIDVRGTLWHHTASPAGSGDLPSIEVCQRGRPDLPGPLCQVLIGRAGTVAVITDGRANHAGAGAWPGISDGNGQLVGVEIENDGRGEPFTAWQLEVARRVGRALRRRFGHALDIGHKEWAPGRKIDPTFDMGAFRASLDSGEETRAVEIVACPTGGYWVVDTRGHVFAFGGAPFHGSLGDLPHVHLAAPVVGMAPIVRGGAAVGYWLVGADGGVFTFPRGGGMPEYGSLPGLGVTPAAPIVSMAATPDGGGYWLLGADGGVFCFGNAQFHGSATEWIG